MLLHVNSFPILAKPHFIAQYYRSDPSTFPDYCCFKLWLSCKLLGVCCPRLVSVLQRFLVSLLSILPMGGLYGLWVMINGIMSLLFEAFSFGCSRFSRFLDNAFLIVLQISWIGYPLRTKFLNNFCEAFWNSQLYCRSGVVARLGCMVALFLMFWVKRTIVEIKMRVRGLSIYTQQK